MPLFEKMFTEMARQSERQIGAFLALHALEFGTPYNLNTDIVKFRNSVIHKGFIPDPEMAEDFCSKVYLEIFNLTQKLRSLSSDSIQKVIMHDLAVRYQKIETGTAKATASGGIFFGIIKTDNKPSFKEALETYRDAKNVLTSSMSTLQSIHNSILNAPKIG